MAAHKMGQDWAQCQRRIHHEQLRYEQLKEQLKDIRTRYSAQFGVSAALRLIEQVLPELLILQKKFMLHLNPEELNSPFIRFLLEWSFKIEGKAKLNALLQELQGYYDTIERTLALYYHSSSRRGPRRRRRRRQDSLGAPPIEHHVQDAIAASNQREDGYSAGRVVPPLTLVSQPLSRPPAPVRPATAVPAELQRNWGGWRPPSPAILAGTTDTHEIMELAA